MEASFKSLGIHIPMKWDNEMGYETCEIHSTNVLCAPYNIVFIVLNTSNHPRTLAVEIR